MNKRIIGIIVIITCVAIIVGIILNNNSIANQKLTKDNYEEVIEKYSEKNKESDNVVYLMYTCTNYIFKDGMAVAFNTSKTEEEKEQETYKNIYGKTINDLIKEGKKMMKENNTTVEKYKESLQGLSNSVDEFNNSINSFNVK